MPDLMMRSWQRVAFAGKTGSGKTFAARFLLRSTQIRRLIVIDPKMALVGDKSWRLEPPSRQAEKALRDGEFARIVYWQAPEIDNDGFPIWDKIFEFAWDVGDIVIYIDEMYSVAKNGRLSYPLRRLYTQGRALGIGVWAATQRPSFVPMEMFSESEWSLIFTLRMEDDRKKVARSLGFDQIMEPIRDEHGFWIVYQTWPDPLYFRQLDTKSVSAIESRADQSVPVV
jgi:DNA helicase HerA-like ATPase